MTAVGRHIFPRSPSNDQLVDGHRTYHYKVLDSQAFEDCMVELLRDLYVPRTMGMEHPNWPLGEGRVPLSPTVQVGDFGEALTYALMVKLGYEVPYVKLHSRTTRDATIQGPDTLCALLRTDTEVLIEVKTRTSRVTSAMLRADLRDGLRRSRDLFSSWTYAVQSFDHYPEKRRAYSYQIACEIAEARQQRIPRRLERHGVIVCGVDAVDGERFWSSWPADLPSCSLHVIGVDNIDAAISRVYARLLDGSFGDVIEAGIALGGVRDFVETVAPGNETPLRSAAPAAVSSKNLRADLATVVESACWFLSGHDGYGSVCARESAMAEPLAAALQALLQGSLRAAREVGPTHLKFLQFADAVDESWRSGQNGDAVRSAAELVAEEMPADEALAVRLVAACIVYRLERHPLRFLPDTTPMCARLHSSLASDGVRALWPGQAAALDKGLLDRNGRAFAVEMATSAGKTLLIEMLTAAACDYSPDRLVIVLAPTRALVAQHTRDLQRRFGRAAVTGLYGGYEYDPTDEAIAGSVAVMTPERFELESRRTRGDASVESRTQLLIVDEAHLLADRTRGSGLELTLARMSSSESCRVVLLSSHFGNAATLLRWMSESGDAQVSTDWRPAPLERGVFVVRERQGVVRWEHRKHDPEVFVTVSGVEANRPVNLFSLDSPVPASASRVDQTAALAIALARSGTVLTFVPQSTQVVPTAERIRAKIARLEREPNSALESLAPTLDLLDPTAATLIRAGIGIHHRGLHAEVRHAVERAARHGWLDIIVSTSTLAEGVDAPIETVLITSLQIARGEPLSAMKLANLGGRAGRGGRYRAGRVVVRAGEADDAVGMLERRLARELPPTRSSLSEAFRLLVAQAERQSPLPLSREAWRQVDDLLLVALEDEIQADGQLRRAIELVLGRTLYAVEHPSIDARLVGSLEMRARYIISVTPECAMRTMFRCTGLPFEVCRALNEALDPMVAIADQSDEGGGGLLDSLLSIVVPVAVEYGMVSDLTSVDLVTAARRWVRGDDEVELIASFRKWHKLVSALDQNILWCLSGAVEILAFRRGLDASQRLALHRSSGAIRVRYGAPTLGVCGVIRAGLTRRRALELHADFLTLGPAEMWSSVSSFEDWVRHGASLSGDDRVALRMPQLDHSDEVDIEHSSVQFVDPTFPSDSP